MLCLNRKLNQAIQINDDITITILEIKRGSVRLGVAYSEKNRVLRHEVYMNVKEENESAALNFPEILKTIETMRGKKSDATKNMKKDEVN